MSSLECFWSLGFVGLQCVGVFTVFWSASCRANRTAPQWEFSASQARVIILRKMPNVDLFLVFFGRPCRRAASRGTFLTLENVKTTASTGQTTPGCWNTQSLVSIQSTKTKTLPEKPLESPASCIAHQNESSLLKTSSPLALITSKIDD